MNVTMKDIARRVGVSVVTVSRALNDKPDIDANTKQRIPDTARQLNYWPNILARRLRAKTTRTIGIVIPDMRDPVFAEILFGCSKTARDRGYQVIVSMLFKRGYDVDEELEAIQTLIGKRVDGLLLQPEHEDRRYIEALNNCPVPYVLMNRKPEGLACSFVTHDHRKGACCAARHLLQRGRKRLLFLVRFPTTSSVLARIEGVKRAMAEYGSRAVEAEFEACGDTLTEAYAKARSILERESRPDAILAWEDIMALGVCRAVLDAGLEIPGDVAVVGYNDIELAAFNSPPLTTVRQKISEIGEQAAGVLLDTLEGSTNGAERILIEPELIVRRTT